LAAEAVSLAREATQIAEDSRTIAAKRAADDRAAKEAMRQTAPAEPVRTATPAVESRGAAERIATPPSPAPQPAAQPAASPARENAAPIEVSPQQFHKQDPNAPVNRRRLLSALSGKFEVTDTPRGIVVTLPESAASSPALSTQLAALARAMSPHRDLHVEVEAHSDRDERPATQQRAEWVRQALASAGLRPDIIVARGLSNDRPVMSNAAGGGRARNRRVEIVIAGDAIGDVATWDRKYPIAPRR
jgi:outer membrane protein OmpA-like peptidoglycan-associated protein